VAFSYCLFLIPEAGAVVVTTRFPVLAQPFLGFVPRVVAIALRKRVIQVAHVVIGDILRIGRIIRTFARMPVGDGIIIRGILLAALVLICRHIQSFLYQHKQLAGLVQGLHYNGLHGHLQPVLRVLRFERGIEPLLDPCPHIGAELIEIHT
jgi:hypothetical protein